MSKGKWNPERRLEIAIDRIARIDRSKKDLKDRVEDLEQKVDLLERLYKEMPKLRVLRD